MKFVNFADILSSMGPHAPFILLCPSCEVSPLDSVYDTNGSAVAPKCLQSCSFFLAEEVILNEDRTTEEERRYIMEARKRAMLKRKKLRTLGKSRDGRATERERSETLGQTNKGLGYSGPPRLCKKIVCTALSAVRRRRIFLSHRERAYAVQLVIGCFGLLGDVIIL